MRLVCDVLDKQIVDQNGRPIGRVDGLLLTVRDGEPPRVAAIEVGATTLARRLPRLLACLLEPLARRFGARGGEPYHIPWRSVRAVRRLDVVVTADARRTGALNAERWLRDHLISRIPRSAGR
jgi:sporulation protein YlmC with PRC-barrel domain